MTKTLPIAERDGERCAGPVLISGFVVGFGVIELATGALNQTSRFSLQLLVLPALAARRGFFIGLTPTRTNRTDPLI